MLEQRLEQDLKTALLARDSQTVSTLRGVKSALLNLKVATGKRESGLSDEEVMSVLSKQSKQRQESADLYVQGKDQARADAELAEKKIIDVYLPQQLSEAELMPIIDKVIRDTGATSPAAMGQVMAAVRAQTAAQADGAVIARLVKEKLNP
jgi:uncharacterized protein YqeY